MKKLLSTLLIGSLALSVSAKAADGDNLNNRRKAKAAAKQSSAQTTSTSPANARANARAFNNPSQVRSQRAMHSARFRQRNNVVTTQSNVNAAGRQNVMRTKRTNRFQASQQTSVRKANRFQNRNNVAVSSERNLNVDGNRSFQGSRRGDRLNRDGNLRINRTRNVTVTNNWRGDRFSGRQYSAFRNYNRQHHHRDWYHHHHNRIVFVFGGAYYWNSGYWYPAWGYNPGYRYIYDGPIYGYNNLSPDRVVVNVQTQLARDGYYRGPIDGQLGPMTREAIAAFQADNGLAVTAAVDEPTLASLGLV